MCWNLIDKRNVYLTGLCWKFVSHLKPQSAPKYATANWTRTKQFGQWFGGSIDWTGGHGSELAVGVARNDSRSQQNARDDWTNMCSVINSKTNFWTNLLLHIGGGKCFLWTTLMHPTKKDIIFLDITKKSQFFFLDFKTSVFKILISVCFCLEINVYGSNFSLH